MDQTPSIQKLESKKLQLSPSWIWASPPRQDPLTRSTKYDYFAEVGKIK